MMPETKEKQGRVLNYEHFDLISFKVKDKSLEAVYYNLLDRDTQQKSNSEKPPHPDLFTKINDLKSYFLDKTGYSQYIDLCRELTIDDQDKRLRVAEEFENLMQRTSITGLSFQGDETSQGVSINGYIKYPKGGGNGISSKKITFGKQNLGYENDVEDKCDEIKKEVYAFLFQGKKAQQEMFDQEPELFDDE
jgi:hypothetical protein